MFDDPCVMKHTPLTPEQRRAAVLSVVETLLEIGEMRCVTADIPLVV
jgi:hypothetical protein